MPALTVQILLLGQIIKRFNNNNNVSAVWRFFKYALLKGYVNLFIQIYTTIFNSIGYATSGIVHILRYHIELNIEETYPTHQQ